MYKEDSLRLSFDKSRAYCTLNAPAMQRGFAPNRFRLPDMTEPVTAALLIIGNEILSGRTQDANARYIAEKLAANGITLTEIRVVPDIEAKIAGAVNALRAENDYLFTTGGIGPTHDDITAESVAVAFGREYVLNEEAHRALIAHYGEEDLNDGRKKMAYMPADSVLIPNSMTGAPGFRTENVFVLAGIPRIMQVMFDAALPHLRKGSPVLSVEVLTDKPESVIAGALSRLQETYGESVAIGSYPSVSKDFKGVSVVLRGSDANLLEQAAAEVRAALA